MATYKKPLYTVEVITICGETYTVADTAEKTLGSDALSQFKMGKVVAIETGENETTYVPFHAICAVKATKSTSDVEKADPYGCEEAEATPDEPTPEP